MPRVMTTAGAELLELYPPFLRRVPLIQAVCNAVGEEVALHDEMLDELERNVIPYTAEEHLALYEAFLGLTPDNPALTLEERKEAVLVFLKRLTMTGSGLDWEEVGDFLIGTNWIYRTNLPGAPITATNPPPHNIYVWLTYAPGSIHAQLAEGLLRSITPAADILTVFYSQGFILDDSLLDRDQLG